MEMNRTQAEQCSSSSSVVALSGVKEEVIVIEESQPLFDDCSETFCDKLDLRALESAPNEIKISDNERLVAKHKVSCKQCTIVSLIFCLVVVVVEYKGRSLTFRLRQTFDLEN